MAPPKASGWPAYIFNDPAVQTLDERGRFIVCGVCAEYYTNSGGKRPKPIVLNGCYRTRAWEVHKQRTRAHNPYQEDRSLTSPPPIPVSASTITSGSQSRPFGEASCWQPYEPRPLDHRYVRKATAAEFNQPPLRDRRRSISPPWSLSTPSWRRHHPVVPESFVRASPYQQSPRTRRMQPPPLMSLTLVFPLVRTPTELRRPSDFDPDWGDRTSSNDWRRLLSSNSPSSLGYDRHTVARTSSVIFTSSYNEPFKAPAYAFPEALR